MGQKLAAIGELNSVWLLNRQCNASKRFGEVYLKVSLVRFPHDRGVVETAGHYLLECTWFEDLRQTTRLCLSLLLNILFSNREW